MSDADKPPTLEDLPPVIELAPFIERRRRSQCKHTQVIVDETEDCLQCSDCKALISPCWWVARLAERWDDYKTRIEDANRKAYEHHERTIACINEHIRREQLKLDTLIAKREQLARELVQGKPLERHVTRWRRK